MIYVVCFALMLVLMLLVIIYEKAIDINLILLILVLAVGSGGFYAMISADNLSEALLAVKISYIIGCFGPMLVFLIMCSICRINIPLPMRLGLYLLQIFVYITVCTIGTLNIFYKSAVFNKNSMGGYLTKEYGFMHTVYMVLLVIYTLAGLFVGIYSLNRKNVVSRKNVYALILSDVIVIGIYIVERVVNLDVELLPVVLSIAGCIYTFILVRINKYSIYSNQSILDKQINSTGFIFFDRSLNYMGCSDYAIELFPELEQWELEKKIPGNGGRFNTFLRQPLFNYMKDGKKDEDISRTYEYKGEVFRYDIGTMRSRGKKSSGYIIQVSNVTTIFKKSESKEAE